MIPSVGRMLGDSCGVGPEVTAKLLSDGALTEAFTMASRMAAA